MNTLSLSIDNYSNICSKLYHEFDITSKQELMDSEYYDNYCEAALHLSSNLVKTSYYYGRISALERYASCNHEDIAQELTLLLINKYGTIIKAMANSGEKHNHKAYTSAILSSLLKNICRKYAYENEANEEEDNDSYDHYSFSSLNALLSDDDGETTFLDMLEGNEASPELNTVLSEEERETSQVILKYMKKLAAHKTKGEVLALLLYGMKAENCELKVRDASALIYNNGNVNITAFYNALLNRYNELALHLTEEELEPLLNYTEKDFGSFDRSSPKAIADKLSKWNNLVKTHLESESQKCAPHRR